MNSKSHIRFWVAVILATFFISPLFRTDQMMESFVSAEVAMTRSTFGNRVANWLEKKADVAYEMLPTQYVDKVRITGDGMRRTKEVVPGAGVAVTVAYNAYIKALLMNAFVATLRFFSLAVWLGVLAPVLIAAAIDGFTQRAIKRAEFGAIRPAAFAVTSMIVIPLFMAPILYLVIPVAVSPLVTPMWAFVTTVPLALMISNMQPMFGKN